MARIILSPAARDDLDAVALYIASESGAPDIAFNWIDGLEERFALLAQSPQIGMAREDIAPGLRHWVVGNYLIPYRSAGDSIEIARVVHGARDLTRLKPE